MVILATTGETLLLRFINAAMNIQFFVSIAGHTMNVVAVDASYTKPFNTSYLMLGPGQTIDVLIHTNHSHGQYYIGARTFVSSSPLIPFHNSTTTAILTYDANIHSKPLLPILPAYTDRSSALNFNLKLKSPSRVKVPEPIDEDLLFIIGLGLDGHKIIASMNDISFVVPETNSILQAAYSDQPGVFTSNFPPSPSKKFNHTIKGTKLYKIKYGSVVQVVLQGNKILDAEDHPMHLHGYDFYVLGRGIGEYVKERDEEKLNMEDPPVRNTVGVPGAGWAVIRFVADNPGVWLMHCHVDFHLELGMAMAFWVENGVGEMESIRSPPVDLPPC